MKMFIRDKKHQKKLAAASVMVMLAAMTSGCGKETDVMNTTVAVNTLRASVGSMQIENTYIGTVADTDEVQVIPLVSGIVTSVNVSVGDIVQEGEVLCMFDDTSAQFTLANAQAGYNNAVASLKSAEAGVGNAQTSVASAQESVNKALSGINSAQANYDYAQAQAQAQINGTKKQQDYNYDMNITQANNGLNDAQDALEDAEDDRDRLERSVKNAKKRRDEAKQALDEAQAELDKANAKSADAQEEPAKNNDGESSTQDADNPAPVAEELQNKNEELQNKVAAAAAAYKEAEAAYSSAKTQYDAAKDRVDTLRDSRDDAQVALQQAQKSKEIYDTDIYNDTLKTQQAQAAVQQANLEAAQIGVDTAVIGLESAQAGVESAQIGVESAQAGVESAQVSVESAQYQLSLYTIYAPVSGRIEQVNVTANNVSSQGNVGFVISNPESKSVVFYVPEDVKKEMQQGQRALVRYGDEEYRSDITEIGVSVDAATGLFKIEATLYDASDLPNGTKVELVTMAHKAENVVLLPMDVIYFDEGEAYVYLVKDGVAVETPVEITIHDSEKMAVSSGVSEGDEVIATWSSMLRDGSAVRKIESGEEINE